jgi:hypothetical protein
VTATLDQKSDISESCSQMMLQLHDVYDPNKVRLVNYLKLHNFLSSCVLHQMCCPMFASQS